MMSDLTPGPMKPFKEQLPLGLWACPYLRVYMGMIGLVVYAYMLYFIKTLILKAQRLDQMTDMVERTEQMIHRIHTVDLNLAINMERLDNGFPDY